MVPTPRAQQLADNLPQVKLVEPQAAHPFCPGAFDEFQVIGIIDDAGKISVFIVDTDGKAVCHGGPLI